MELNEERIGDAFLFLRFETKRICVLLWSVFDLEIAKCVAAHVEVEMSDAPFVVLPFAHVVWLCASRHGTA